MPLSLFSVLIHFFFPRSRLQRPAVELGKQDLRPGDHGAPEKVRREHLRRRLPSVEAVHRQHGRGRSRESFCLKKKKRRLLLL